MKVKLFTHNDLDGVGCAILGKLVFEDKIDIEYCSYDNINDKVKDFYSSYGADKNNYDKVFITDISVSEEVAQIIEWYTCPEVKLFDHHGTALNLNRYDWAKVMEEDQIYDDSGAIYKTSGTYLFFEYLREYGMFGERSLGWGLDICAFVDTVRKYDTWEWNTVFNDVKPKQWNDLFYLYGRDRFIEMIIDKIGGSRFKFSDADIMMLEITQEKIDRYIESKQKQMIEKEILNFKVGIVFAEQYHSEVGNVLATNNPHLDFIVLINPSYSVSYRGIKDEINLGQDVAKIFGGGGHPKAAGSPISEDIKNKIIDLIFGN